MGFFSWKTADTNESILNRFACEDHGIPVKTVYLLQPNGLPPIEETSYEGYGVFGEIDAYSWLASMKGLGDDRMDGIDLAFDNPDQIEFPLKFSFNKNAKYEELPASEDCPYQGYFIDEEDIPDSYLNIRTY